MGLFALDRCEIPPPISATLDLTSPRCDTHATRPTRMAAPLPTRQPFPRSRAAPTRTADPPDPQQRTAARPLRRTATGVHCSPTHCRPPADPRTRAAFSGRARASADPPADRLRPPSRDSRCPSASLDGHRLSLPITRSTGCDPRKPGPSPPVRFAGRPATVPTDRPADRPPARPPDSPFTGRS